MVATSPLRSPCSGISIRRATRLKRSIFIFFPRGYRFSASVRQIQQHSIRIRQRVLAELAALEIFLPRLAVAADGDFSRVGAGRGGGKILDILLSRLEVLYLKPEVVESRHQPTVLHHVPGPQRDCQFAVGNVVAVVTRQTLDGPEIENLLVIFRQVSRARAADSDVIDPSGLLPTLLKVALAHVGHPFLRKIELIAVGIMGSKAGEGNMALTLGDENVRVAFFEAVFNSLNIFHLEAEVVESRQSAGLALEQGQTDDAVAQMAAFFVIDSVLVGHPGGDLLHAEKSFVKVRHAEMVVGMNGDVSDLSGHNPGLLVAQILLKDARSCQLPPPAASGS